jgi:hypothetical protein
VIIKGTPFPDLVRMELDFGQYESIREVPSVAAGLDEDLGRGIAAAGALAGRGVAGG